MPAGSRWLNPAADCTRHRLAGLEFESATIIKGVALGFAQLHKNVLTGLNAIGILHRRIHLAENAEVIQFLLGVQEAALAQRVSRLDLQLTVHDVGPGELAA